MSQAVKNDLKNIPVVILAGGKGINLGPQGRCIAKPLVEINGIPLLLYIMDHYGKAGFGKFIICGGFGIDSVKAFVANIPALGARLKPAVDRSKWSISVADTGMDNMTGSRLAQISSMLKSSPLFCLTYGDTVAGVGLEELLSFHLSHQKTGTLLAVHNPTRFRILGLCGDEDLIKGFAEKPVLEKDYINGGFYIFNSSIFNLKSLFPDPACVLETTVLEELILQKQLCAYRFNGFWQHLDTERDKQKIIQHYSGVLK
ncbi:MAG TPA: sugar phosphate nucleotidyltransferase [Candidatus Omnitrophota bacterium]|nr:sugar phosphate nucleotidyltransferase [Candidatus Omnitrophota bacterium]